MVSRESAVSWILGLAIAGVAVLILLWRRARPRLRIDERGILDPRLRLGLIRWDEINGAYHPSARDGDAVQLELRVTERIRRRLAGAAPGPTLDVRLDLSRSDISPTQLVQKIVASR